MSTNPTNLDFVQAGLRAWLLEQFPLASVLWHESEHPRARTTDTVFLLRIVAGPNAEPFASTSRLLPLLAVFRVTGATPGLALFPGASGRRWEYVVPSGATVTSARDGLLAQMQTEPTVSANIAARDTDGIEVEALDIGDLFNLEARGLLSIEIEDSELADVQFGEVHYSVEIEVRSTSRYPRDGAISALSKIQSRLRRDSLSYGLDRYGLTVSEQAGASIIPIPALSGSKAESRAALRIGVCQMSVAAEPAITIETVGVTVQALDGVDIDEEFDVP